MKIYKRYKNFVEFILIRMILCCSLNNFEEEAVEEDTNEKSRYKMKYLKETEKYNL